MPITFTAETVFAMFAIVEVTQLWAVHHMATEGDVEKRFRRHLKNHHTENDE